MMLSRLRFSVMAPLLFCVAACERETAPLPREVASPGAIQTALASSSRQSFDVAMRSGRDGETQRQRVMHVVRQKAAKGWRTSIRFDPTEVPKGKPPVPNEITGIEIDEDGRKMMSVQGRAPVPLSSGKVTVGPGPRGIAVTTEESAARGSGAGDPFDMLGKVLFAKSETSSRKARTAKTLGLAQAHEGRLVYRQDSKHGTAEFEFEDNSGLLARSKGPGPKGSSLVVEHTYKETGSLFVRTSTTNTLTGNGKPLVTTLSLSNIVVDGKEIVR